MPGEDCRKMPKIVIFACRSGVLSGRVVQGGKAGNRPPGEPKTRNVFFLCRAGDLFPDSENGREKYKFSDD